MSTAGRHRQWLLRGALAVLLALVLAELVGFACVRTLAWMKPHLFYVPDVVGREEYERYLAERDPVLGWPRPERLAGDDYDAAGSRMVPAYPDPAAGPTLVSLYGDSMTESLEVDDAAAWGNQLAVLLGGRVANFGVSGFGTDQAYLRFLGNDKDDARIVVLNHFSDDAMRNVNQWRYLISTSAANRLTFKPRFVAAGAELVPVPLPTFGYEDYVACVGDPSRCLEHEFFLPDDGISGVQTMRFPYALTLLRLTDNFMLGSRLRGAPRHAEHYRRDHPSDVLRVTRFILRDFVAAARARGRIPIVTIIPDGKDLVFFRAHGVWTYQPLIDDLRSQDGIEVLNFGPGLLARLGDRSPCEIINACYRHFNAEGYRILAELAFAHLGAIVADQSPTQLPAMHSPAPSRVGHAVPSGSAW